MSSSSFHRTSKTLGDNMGLVSAVIAVLVAGAYTRPLSSST